MNIKHVLCNVDEFLGKPIELQGMFILVGEDGFFVDSFEEADSRTDAISVDIPAILDVMTPKVPPYAGSKYYYADPAQISGRLLRSEGGDDFKYKISDIDNFIINKSGHVLSVFD